MVLSTDPFLVECCLQMTLCSAISARMDRQWFLMWQNQFLRSTCVLQLLLTKTKKSNQWRVKGLARLINFFTVTGRWIKETYHKRSIDYSSTIFNLVITQLNQIILPPFKLPYFKKIGDDKKLCAKVLTDLIFLQDKCEDVDFINDNRRVQKFSNIV